MASVPLPPPLQPGLARPNCEYLQLCQRFKLSLSLPSAYFSSADNAVCHCQACHRLRGDPAYVKKGSPVRDSSTPVGWCRCSVSKLAYLVTLIFKDEKLLQVPLEEVVAGRPVFPGHGRLAHRLPLYAPQLTQGRLRI